VADSQRDKCHLGKGGTLKSYTILSAGGRSIKQSGMLYLRSILDRSWAPWFEGLRYGVFFKKTFEDDIDDGDNADAYGKNWFAGRLVISDHGVAPLRVGEVSYRGGC